MCGLLGLSAVARYQLWPLPSYESCILAWTQISGSDTEAGLSGAVSVQPMLSNNLFPVFFFMFDQFFFCFLFLELMMAACLCWLGSVS